MPDGKGTLTWTDGRGKEQTRETNLTLDIRDFRGTPGFPWLVIAANRHLSVDILRSWLEWRTRTTNAAVVG
jgi:hypothetical protein